MAETAKSIVKWSAGIVAFLVAVFILLPLVILYFVDWNILKPWAEDAAGSALGRSVSISNLDVDLGNILRITANGLAVSNVDWAEEENFTRVDTAEIGVRLWPLLRGELVFSEIILERPVLNLARNEKGDVNWKLGTAARTAGDAAKPDSRETVPAIERILFTDGKLSVRDAERELFMTGDIATARGDAAGDDRINARIKGSLAEKPIDVKFSGGSAHLLRETEKPFPIDLKVAFGSTNLAVKGTLTEPLKLKGLDLGLAINGPSLSAVFPLLGIPLPDTPEYAFTGDINRREGKWQIHNFKGKVGRSDIAGTIALDQRQEPPFLTANLVSNRLDSADVIVAAGEVSPETEQDVIPDTPIDYERLDAMNMDITFEGRDVIANNLPLENVSARLQLRDRRVLVKPLSLSIAKGEITGELAFNAREQRPSADADLIFKNLDLKPFFKNTEFVQETGGRFSGELYLLGVGDDVNEILSTINGQGWVSIEDGTLSALLLEAAGLDIAEALVLFVDEDVRSPIRCGRVDIQATDGAVLVERAIIDTKDSILLARGTVSIPRQELDINIKSLPKDFSLLDLAAPVSVSGSFTDPAIGLGDKDSLALLQFGDATDVDCDRLIAGELSRRDVEPKD